MNLALFLFILFISSSNSFDENDVEISDVDEDDQLIRTKRENSNNILKPYIDNLKNVKFTNLFLK